MERRNRSNIITTLIRFNCYTGKCYENTKMQEFIASVEGSSNKDRKLEFIRASIGNSSHPAKCVKRKRPVRILTLHEIMTSV